MNCIVCVKQVPGTTRVEVDPATGVLKRDGVKSKLNPYDLYALEEALRIAQETGGFVKTLSMGPPQAKEALLETLWIGADEGLLLSDRKFGGADVAATSNALALGIGEMGDYDLIFCGKQTTDGDTAQVGPELAERLGIEHVSNVTKILSVDGESVTAVTDTGDAFLTVRIKLPCLLTIDQDTNTPRLPSYLRRKSADPEQKIRIMSAADFPQADESKLGLKGSPTQVERIFPPEKNGDKVQLSGATDELAEQLYVLLGQRKFL